MPAVGGFVFDSSGAPVDREIRIYRRDTGALLGKTRSSGGDGDPHFENVALLLHMDGGNGGKTFVDSSLSQKTVSAAGDAAISTAKSKWGGASLLLDGSGDYLSVQEHDDFVFGTGDFTVELWVNTTATAEKALLDQYNNSSNSWQFSIKNGTLQWYSDEAYALVGSIPVNTGAWHHVAATRSAGTLRLFVDGTLDGTVALGTNYTPKVALGIGAQVASRNASYDLPGNIDDLRITKGVCRYTANFTPPTAPFQDIPSLGRPLVLGEYYFVDPYAGEVNVVCLDDASAPLENDLILRTFPV